MSQFTPITAEQIERFFESRCTSEEAEAVSKYLQEHPDVFQHYVQRDWQEAATGADLPEEYSQKMFKEIKERSAKEKSTLRNRRLGRMRRMTAVAAAVVVLTVSVWLLRPIAGPSVAKVETPVQTAGQGQIKPASALRILHSTGQEKHRLPDGSTVVLYANSTLTYPEPFEPQRRALSVEGRALFSVTKDGTRPFIVTAGNIETTVLGTEFLVTGSPDKVMVRLFSGKVRLHAKDRQWRKDIVLAPGEQLDYVIKNAMAVVSRWNEKTLEEETAVTEPMTEQELVFDNEPLPFVMDKLAASYHVNIRYDRKQLANINFTGNVLTSEPLTTMLDIIANMNELTIIPEKKGYTIRK